MKTRTITAACQKCGEVKIKIYPEYSRVRLVCIACGEELANASCGDYRTIPSVCTECNGEVFKAKISIDESGNESWSAKCVECDEEVRTVLVDKELNSISEEEFKFLVLSDKVEELTNKVECLVNEISDLTEKEKNNKDNIYSLDNDIYDLQWKLREVEESCDENDDKINNIKYRVEELERKVEY
ncbi:hypothetical protein [Clostridium tertium]|uniref:hypothetical protein n=1 Tax=Clostridium tertium TaxID=1559 RepID=UPI001AEB81EE|nr:hypothetical protein [Clostridium tertium]MBP1868998.1 polyhydroxyalkanoate synthesis regulator phasin/ribosomal protein S27E [Clostridium tertium]